MEKRMTEGRRMQVVLLDERRLDILVKSKLYAGELLDIVASHFNLKEKEYFGLAYLDETGHYCWLQLDKKVLEQDLPKKLTQSAFVLYFLVKYFVESITQLKCSHTVEAFYLQSKSLIFKGIIETDSDTAFQLAALVLQVTYGDYVDDATTKDYLKRLPILPASALKEHPSLSVCEEKVIEHYKNISGQTRGEAIVNYLSIAERLPTYGIHYYEVKDKRSIPWWLGLNHKGISQYDYSDRKSPRLVFLWKQLDNLYFRDKKFTIEVHEVRRVVHALSSFNLYEDAIEEPIEDYDELSDAICDPTTQVSVSRRTFGPAKVTVFVWIASTPSLTKCIWSMAISQHQFYLDHKHRKSQVYITRSLGQIAAELSCSVQSLSSGSSLSNLSRSASSSSLPVFQIDTCQTEESRVARVEMLSALKARKEALEEALKKKTEELKALCLKEGELSGELPIETPLAPGEAIPQVRRRIGTAFTLSDQLICKLKTQEEEVLAKLELDYEIQSKITSAAFKLANDISTRKSVRKQRKVGYHKAQAKLKDMEQKLMTAKKQRELLRRNQKKSVTEESGGDNVSYSTDESDGVFKCHAVNLSDVSNSFNTSRSEETKNHINQLLLNSNSPSPAFTSSSSSSLHLGIPHNSSSAPPSPAKHRHEFPAPPDPYRSISHSATLRPRKHYPRESILNGQTKDKPITRSHSIYSTSSEYDNVSCSSGSMISLRMPYQNRFEASLDIEGSNMYNVPNRRTSQVFESQEDLLTPLPGDCDDRGMILHTNSLLRKQNYYADQYSNRESLSYQTNSLPQYGTGRSNFSFDNEQKLPPYPSVQVPIHLHQQLSGHIDSRSLDNLDNTEMSHRVLKNCYSSQNLIGNAYSENICEPDSFHNKVQNVQYMQSHISEPDLNALDGQHEIKTTEVVLPISLKDRKNKSVPTFFNSNSGLRHAHQTEDKEYHLSPLRHQFSSQSSLYSTNFSIQNSPPKVKTKEWIETCLDSPVTMCQSKTKETPTVESCSTLSNTSFELGADINLAEDILECISISPPNKAHEMLDPGPILQTATTQDIGAPISPSVATHSFQPGVEVNIVSVGHFQPYWEETKPYEMSDFYKYSTKHRKKQSNCDNKFVQEQQIAQYDVRGWGDGAASCEMVNNDLGGNQNVIPDQSNLSANYIHLRNSVATNMHPTLESRSREPKQQQPPPSESAFSSPDRLSVVDTFHDEMLAWYADQESVKKATLV